MPACARWSQGKNQGGPTQANPKESRWRFFLVPFHSWDFHMRDCFMVSFPQTQITKRTSRLQGTFLLFSGPVGAPSTRDQRHSGEQSALAQLHVTRGALAKASNSDQSPTILSTLTRTGDGTRRHTALLPQEVWRCLLTRQHSGDMTPHPDLSLMPRSGPRSPHSKVYGFLSAVRGKQLPAKTWTHSRAQRPVTSKQKT